MVFIHGGGFQSGSSNSNLYGPDFLIARDVVLVTINYRLNIFGECFTRRFNFHWNERGSIATNNEFCASASLKRKYFSFWMILKKT